MVLGLVKRCKEWTWRVNDLLTSIHPRNLNSKKVKGPQGQGLSSSLPFTVAQSRCSVKCAKVINQCKYRSFQAAEKPKSVLYLRREGTEMYGVGP